MSILGLCFHQIFAKFAENFKYSTLNTHMGSILQIESLTKSFGDRILFSDISLGVAEGDKIGIIAKNGTGKSTLLRIITGSEDYDSGRITFRSDLRVGYLAQVPQLDPNLSIIDVCLSGDDALSLALRNY